MHLRHWLARASLATALLASSASAAPQSDAAPPRTPLPPGAFQFGQCQHPLEFQEGDSVEELVYQLQALRTQQPELYGPTALPERVVLVPDTAPQAELHLVYDEDPWVKPALDAMIAAAAPHGTVVLHVRDPSELFRAERLLSRLAPRSGRISTAAAPDSIWLRDFAGHPVQTPTGPARVDFRYSTDCLVDDAWPNQLGTALRIPLFLEGGNLLTDGTRCYATDVIAHDNGLDLDQTATLLRSAGCTQTVWLRGAPQTISHTDPFLALGDPTPDGRPVFLLARVPAGIDVGTHEVLEENARKLATLGTVLRVDVGEARPLLPVLNVQVFNGVVMVPRFEEPVPEATLEVLQQAWPRRSLAQIPARGLADLDGGPHCIATTVPR